LVFYVVLLQLMKGAHRPPQQQHRPVHPSEARFASLQIVTRCQLTCTTALGCSIGQRERLQILRWLLDGTQRRRASCNDSLWCRALLLTILAGDIEVNPGPASRAGQGIPTMCLVCDKDGRKNAIKVPCTSCSRYAHKVCLKKHLLHTELEVNKLIREKSYICWSCSMPTLNDSFWSLPSIPPAPPSPPRCAASARGRSNKSAIKFLCFNARSLKNRKRAADLCAFLDTHSPDVCAINETWLSPDITSHEFVPRDFVVLRKDRLWGKKPAGGVALAIRPHLQPSRVEGLDGGAEIIWASIKAGGLKLLVGSSYRRPNAEAAYNKELKHSIRRAADVQHQYDGLFLMGDFNLDADWTSEPPLAGAAPAPEFLDEFSDMALTQKIKDPTRTTKRTEKTIDLFLTDVPSLVTSAKVVPGVSDHDALLATLSVSSVRPSSAPREVYNFDKADWKGLNGALAVRLRPVLQEGDLNLAWEQWKATVFECADQFVPKKRIGGRKSRLPWLDAGLKQLISIKDALFTQWLRCKTAETRAAFVSARKSTQSALRAARDSWMWRLGSGPDGSNSLWRFVNAKAKAPLHAASFDVSGQITSDPQVVANAFTETFKKNFQRALDLFQFRTSACRSGVAATGSTPELRELHISPADVHNLLQVTKERATPGPDGVPAALLKHCAVALAPSLAHVFQRALNTGELPVDWKTAAVTPIFKDGDKQDVKNYRPISITSLVGKLLERFVRDKTSEFLEANKVIPTQQHGFRARRSCTTLLAGTIDGWAAKLDEKSGAHIHVVFLDWAKAFDRVDHKRLLSKLSHYGIKGALLKWFESFLTGRTQFVRYGGARSEPSDVPSGVIQGSVLGPLLFILFVADLPDLVKTNIVQYADDCSLEHLIERPEDADKLQEDLHSVEIWCANNGMDMNEKKCKVMDVTRARTPLYYQYTLGGEPLQYVDQQRLLGVNLTCDLRWGVHTDKVRAKAAQNLGFLSRNLHGCTSRVKRMAYLSLVRPTMTFGLPAWHPTTVENTKKLERVHKRAQRFIYGRQPPPPRQQNIMSVKMHLRHTDLVFFKKCSSGAIDFDARARIIQGRVLRGDDARHPRLQPPPARGILGQRALSFRVVKPWNDLPTTLKDCAVDKFPALLRAHLWESYE
jgi:Reverse transcriptase (RNA-dependent DNA polymerase)/Endonuclease-reverse transcriptase